MDEQKVADQESDLSEGELPDSDKSEDDAQPAPAKKKQKMSPPEEGEASNGEGKDDSLNASVDLNFGSWKSSLSKRQLKKQQKKRKELKKRADRRRMSKGTHSNDGFTRLTTQQSNVLQRLIQFRNGDTSSGFDLPKLKTAKFKEVMYHLVLSAGSHDEDGAAADSGRGRVVVVWLSMVSEQFYNESSDHFPLLKKLNPALRLKVEHPGSQRFAKLGLEAFMMKSAEENEANSFPQSQVMSHRSSDSPPPPRISYLFTKDQLLEHGFPVMESPIDMHGNDCSSYLQLYPWPSVSVEDSLSTSEDGEEDETEKEMPIFAVDCEMVETAKGSELARISVVNEALDCIYDTYVKPDSTITDYRTKFSGISEDKLKDVTTTLDDVQEKLKSLLPPQCIFAGHSLENDFHAMKLVHPYVIDTSCIFTPYSTALFKPKLKKLAAEVLTIEIQTGEDGHNSIEDATACMRLVQRKLAEGPDLKVSFNQPAMTLLSELEIQNYATGIVDKVGVVRLFGRHSTCRCESDSDAKTVEQALQIIPQCDLTFLQLHDMECFVKSAERNDKAKQLKVANVMDSYLIKLIEGCPSNTMVFVVCGSSDISKVKYYQQQDSPDLRRWKEATMVARTGQVITLMVN